MWRGFVYIEGRKQRNGGEDEKSTMIVPYARYIRLPAGSITGLPQLQQLIAKPPRERTPSVSSFLAVQLYICKWTSLLCSARYASTPISVRFGHETHESRSLQR